MKKISLNYQLGLYVGEYIVELHLPTLSTDALKTRKVIEISSEETTEWERLSTEYTSIYISNNDPDKKSKEEAKSRVFYENRKWYIKLEEKYLPETIEVMVPKVSPTNMKQFEEGIKASLWDSDLSHYWVEEGFLKETHKYSRYSIIILTRKITKVPEKFA